MNVFFHDLKRVFTGYTAGKAQEDDLQCRTIVLIASLSIPSGSIFAIINYMHGRIWLATMLIITISLLSLCFRLLADKKHLKFTRNLMMAVSIFIFMGLLVDGGIGNASIMWSLLFPFLRSGVRSSNVAFTTKATVSGFHNLILT